MKINRLGIVGDVHGADEHLATALRFLRASGADAIVCVGDVTDGIGDAGRCCRLLREFEVVTVRGNHDRWFLAGEMRGLPDITSPAQIGPVERRFLQALPATHTLETIAGRLLLCHGTGVNDMQSLTMDDGEYALHANRELQRLLTSREFRFVVCGHTHRRMVRRFEALTAINPGLLHDAYDAGFDSGIAIADFGAGHVEFYDFEQDALANSKLTVLL